ncbi:MAG: hypothetical protein NC908_00800 [Candidatus Omnitrophica bacterium]|nr:hypothetical protein [Candidatus Omnitrophota bacterium]
MQKIRYELDPHNRLIAKGSGIRGIRKVLEGNFRISGHNDLVYHLKEPIPWHTKAPHQVKLKGSWSLNSEHQLRFILDKWQRHTFGDQLTLQGEIVGVEKNSLLFAVASRTAQDKSCIYILELVGIWQVDTHNRITFKVNRGKEQFDTLTFQGIWQIDKNYQIVYKYVKQDLLRKRKIIHTLVFHGYWDIQDRTRISYVISKNTGSVFDFKTSLGIFREKYIRYELGIGLSRKSSSAKKIITFFGRWRITKAGGLVFELERQGHKIQDINFGAEIRLNSQGKLLFNLRNRLHKEIGIELELSQDTFRGVGQRFLRLIKTRQETAIMLGKGFRW